jgi:chromosome segregation ATPase
MLRDSDIDSLTNHLGALSKENQKHHETLQDVLGQFKCLLEDYSSLKSDYEEVKEGREKYKRQARGQVRSSNRFWAPDEAGDDKADNVTGPQPIRAGAR